MTIGWPNRIFSGGSVSDYPLCQELAYCIFNTKTYGAGQLVSFCDGQGLAHGSGGEAVYGVFHFPIKPPPESLGMESRAGIYSLVAGKAKLKFRRSNR